MSDISFSYKMENLQGKRPPCTEIRSSSPFRQQVIIIFYTITVKRTEMLTAPSVNSVPFHPWKNLKKTLLDNSFKSSSIKNYIILIFYCTIFSDFTWSKAYCVGSKYPLLDTWGWWSSASRAKMPSQRSYSRSSTPGQNNFQINNVTAFLISIPYFSVCISGCLNGLIS